MNEWEWKERQTWSFRLLPVCSFPAGAPISSWKERNKKKTVKRLTLTSQFLWRHLECYRNWNRLLGSLAWLACVETIWASYFESTLIGSVDVFISRFDHKCTTGPLSWDLDEEKTKRIRPNNNNFGFQYVQASNRWWTRTQCLCFCNLHSVVCADSAGPMWKADNCQVTVTFELT